MATEESGAVRGERQASKGKSKTPALDSFGRDLTELARQGKLDPVIGPRQRDRARHSGPQPPHQEQSVLLGEPAFGKDRHRRRAGPARHRQQRPRPAGATRRIVVLDLAHDGGRHQSTAANLKSASRPSWNEVRRAKNTILFIDELHTLVGAGGAEGAIGRLQRAQAGAGPRRDPVHRCHHARRVPQVHREGRRPRTPLPADHRQPAVEGRDGQDPRRAARPLRGASPAFRSRTRRLHAAVELSDRYISGRCLPDKAIDVIDEPAPASASRR